MGTKNHPGAFDCYAAADDDEPMFVLLARDEQAPELVEKWAATRRRDRGQDDPKAAEAMDCARAMRSYRRG